MANIENGVAKLQTERAAMQAQLAASSNTPSFTSTGCWQNCPRVWSTSGSIGRPYNSASCGALAAAHGYPDTRYTTADLATLGPLGPTDLKIIASMQNDQDDDGNDVE